MNTLSETPGSDRPAPSDAPGTLTLALMALLGAILLRLVPHPANLSLVGALGLYAGARLRSWQAILLPLAAMGLSDVILLLDKGYPSFNPVVYTSFLIYALVGGTVVRQRGAAWIVTGAVLGSVQFFLFTNLAVWIGASVDPATIPGGESFMYVQHGNPYSFPMIRYAQNLQGLLTCYAMALPFTQTDAPPLGYFGNLLAGDLGFTGLLFGSHAWLTRRARRPLPRPIH